MISRSTQTCTTQSQQGKFTLKRSRAAVQMALLVGLSAGLFAATSAPAYAQAEAKRQFNIPAGSLQQVLNHYANAAGITFTPDSAMLQGKQSSGLAGSYSINEGFFKLLHEHGLQASRSAQGNYTLSAISAGTANLPTISVRAGKTSDTAEPYAGGQVAYRGRVGVLGDKDFMETPFATISYTDKFIADKQAKDITDVISAADPTVFSNGATGTFSENYSIRGFASSIGDVTFGGLYGVAPYYRSSPEMFERIDVLKGPSALLNGMPPGGSVGGAVNLVPKRAGEEALRRITATYMSNSQFGGHIDIGQRLGDNKEFGLRFNGVARGGEGAIQKQKKKTQLASLGLDWRGERARVSADLFSSVDRVDGLTRGLSLAPGVPVPTPPKPDTLLNPDWAYTEIKDKGAALRAEFDVNENLLAYVAAGMGRADFQQSGAQTGLVLNAAGDMETKIGQLAFNVDKKSAEAGLAGKLKTGDIQHQWTLNATSYTQTNKEFGRRNVLTWLTNIYNPVWGPAPSFAAPQFLHTELKLSSVGLVDTLSFAQGTVQLTLGARHQKVLNDSFNVQTGARVSHYEQSATSPAIALLYKFNKQISLYGNVIEGLSQGATAPSSAANAGEIFPPFKTKQKELGVKFDLGEFTHTLSTYEIVRPSSFIDPLSKIFSFGGEQRNRGLDWSFFGSPVAGLRLMGGVAYVDPILTKTAGGVNQDKQVTGVPKLQAKLGVEWDVPAASGLTLSAGATSTSKQYLSADNSQELSGRTVFDLGARYTDKVSGYPLTVRASVNNVTNQAYWGMPLLSSLTLGAPRTFMLSATVGF